MEHRARLFAGGIIGLLLLGTTGCGGLPISLSGTPTPPVVGQPLTYTVQMQNSLTCDAVDPFIVFLPLVPNDATFNGVCQLLTANNLDALCGMVETQDQAEAVSDICCRLTDFANSWPDACQGGFPAPASLRDRLRNFPFGSSVPPQDVQPHADFSASASDALGALSCSTTSIGPGLPALDCTGTLHPGDTATATFTVTPTTPGSFGTIAVAFAGAECALIANASEGAACLAANVQVAAPAPLLSTGSLGILVGLLATAGAMLLVRSRRRPRYTAV